MGTLGNRPESSTSQTLDAWVGIGRYTIASLQDTRDSVFEINFLRRVGGLMQMMGVMMMIYKTDSEKFRQRVVCTYGPGWEKKRKPPQPQPNSTIGRVKYVHDAVSVVLISDPTHRPDRSRSEHAYSVLHNNNIILDDGANTAIIMFGIK